MKTTTKQKRQAGFDDYMKEFETGAVVEPPATDAADWWFGYWKAHWEHPLTAHRYALNMKFQTAARQRAPETWNLLRNHIPGAEPWDQLTEDRQKRIAECLQEEAYFIAQSMNL